jgi:oxygen-independent coproporphyrinogen-3 oxidase
MRFPTITDELLARIDQPGPRYTSYPTAPIWSTAFGPTQHAAALARAGAENAPLSIYVHVPFCQAMCSYCGCNVVVDRTGARAARYLEMLPREIGLVADHLGRRRAISRLHLGGGTPTFLDEQQLEQLHRAIADRFDIGPDAEQAIEIDPAVTRPTQLETLARLGFNRISMGVQDFDPQVQRAVARIQSVEETRAMVDKARAVGFRSVNLDLIYGLPHQTPATWTRLVEEVVGLGPDRIAVFSFAYVPELRPHQRRLPVAALTAGRAKLDLLRTAYDGFVAAGYRPIGMDHFARPDDDLGRAADGGTVWRDFQGYSAGRAGDTVAFGPSAISDVGGAYAQNHHQLRDWEGALERDRLPTARGHRLGADDRRRHELITALMCNFVARLDPDLVAERAALAPLIADGLVRLDGDLLLVTPLGRPFVRNVAMVFDAYLHEAGAAGARFSRTV